ncbi:MAG TPA: carbohydrate-binding domain-containing protein [Anaerolineaceae bacterium]|nr:carbohydrate-binding domain-containing protein [Anaerolineaceae bacterium]HPN53141.1 carbohydrate-binding domain-containing protein [Anaerolineaceae bacterium]
MKKIKMLVITMMMILTLVACSAASQAQSTTSTNSSTATNSSSAASAVTLPTAVPTVTNIEVNETQSDYTWDSASAVSITLNSDSITASGAGVTVDGSKVIITAAGTYQVAGALNDGQLVVDTKDDKTVQIVLNGVDIKNSTSAPLFINKAEKVVILLADGSTNTLTDATTYVYASADENEPNAALFSKADMSIAGNGTLVVNGNFADGITSKDGLIIASGAITVNSVDDGIRGKDYLVVEGGSITVNAQGDGLKSDNGDDASKGFITVKAGDVIVTSGGDGLSASTSVTVTDGNLTLTTGATVNGATSDADSTKGIKGIAAVYIQGGVITANTADDAIHSNGNIVVDGGTFNIIAGDDGMHADTNLTINNGIIDITRSYEGIESAVITLNGGTIHIASSDDAINVASGNDGSGMMRPGGQMNQDTFNYTGSNYLYINGGMLVVDAGGDGLDVNGAIVMTDGLVLVNGPTENMNGALDYDGGFKMTGGTLVAAGSSGMAMAPDGSSSVNSVLVYFTSTLPAGTLVHIQNSAGEAVMTFTVSKATASIVFASSGLTQGTTYDVYTGGSTTDAVVDGLVQGGSYSGGTKFASFTVSSVMTTVGTGGMGGGGRGPRP